MPKPDKPAPVAMNLDTLDREARPEPFAVVHGGRHYEFVDPQDIDWRDLIQVLQRPAVFFEKCLSPEDSPEFEKTPMPGWKLNALISKYLEHYGVPSLPEASALPQL